MDSKLLLIVALATALTAVSFNNNTNQVSDFEAFKATHSKNYATAEEEAYRFAVYLSNVEMINTHNAKTDETYDMEVNRFSDLTEAEFKATYLGFLPSETSQADNIHTDESFVGDVNWVTKGKVQAVKDQGQCGSCWAFSTAASTESLAGIKTGTVGDFSEQELVSCCAISHLTCTCMGCNGGNMDQGFGYYKNNGICTESSYPYTAKSDFSSCAAKTCSQSSFKVKGHTDVSAGSTSALKSAADKQPVSIAVDASKWSPYKSGIFSNCGTSLDHGVLLAGYTSSYWLVKNSWGKSWGENGYIRVKSGNTCGIANQASYPTA